MTSTTAAGVIDIKKTFFDYPELTKISGEPTVMSLLKLKNELKANAQSVPTVLGGGQHGHLSLILTTEEYENIAPNTPYVQPTLSQLNTETGDTQFVLAQKRHQYEMAMLTYREAIAVDRILIQQIVSAMDEKILKVLRDQNTNRIVIRIADILIYLSDTYGDISPQELAALRENIEKMLSEKKEPSMHNYENR